MPNDASSLSAAEWADLEDRADRFHAALRGGPVTDWEPFLGYLPLRLRAAVLAELVIIDLGHRYSKGESPLVEEYVRRFPELGPTERVPGKLLLEELRCRQKFGPKPAPGEYHGRFPIQAAALGDALDVVPTFDNSSGMISNQTIVRDESEDSVVVSAMKIEGVIEKNDQEPSGSGQGSALMSVNSRYDLIRILGSGAFADVWLARRAPSGIEVAVKIVKQAIDKNAAQRELGSLELIKNLRHPYLLATLDYWVSKSKLHIVMELADSTLRTRLKQCISESLPGIPREELLPLFAEAAEGLDFLHSKSITHRDVKPDNILILNGHTKVADFGLARQQDELMASMSFAGTPIYMSPEGWSGRGGPASDQYSLAFAYVEVRQGVPPIKPAAFADVMFAHMEGKFDFSDIIPPEEQAVLRKALAKEPELRYPTCAAFVEALADACGSSFVIRRSRKRSSGQLAVEGIASRVTGESPVSQRSGLMETQIPRGTLGEGLRPTAKMAVPPPPVGEEELVNLSAKPDSEWLGGKSESAKKPPRSPLPIFFAGLVVVGILAGGAIFLVRGTGDSVVAPPPTTAAPTTEPVDPGMVWLPKNAQPAPDAKVVTLATGQRVHSQIVFPNLDAKHPPKFVLIPGTGADGARVPPFYILETKVWNGLYSDFARNHNKSVPAGDSLAPVTGVTAADAQAFAEETFGGTLPSASQWDHAAGFYDRRGMDAPTMTGGFPKVQRATPAPMFPVDPASDDHSPLGIRDMAGNGREWTRTPLEPRQNTDLRILRGRSFTLRSPLTYGTLAYEQKVPQTQFPTVPSPYTSFRVAIEIPAKEKSPTP